MNHSRNLRLILPALLLAFLAACQTTPTPSRVESSQPVTLAVRATVSPHTVRVASFNIENLGAAKFKHPEVIASLVDIVHKYDLIAVQEIADSTLKTPSLFLKAINSDPNVAPRAMVVSPRTGTQPADKSAQEQYAIYYNTRTIRALGSGELYPDSAENLFRREPLVAEFTTTDGRLKFVVITIHTAPPVAAKEIAALRQVYEWSKARFPDQDGAIIMGDLNAGANTVKPATLTTIRENELNYLWTIGDDAKTSLAGQAHDRIILAGKIAKNFANRSGVDNSFTSGEISDHWPVWAELTVTK